MPTEKSAGKSKSKDQQKLKNTMRAKVSAEISAQPVVSAVASVSNVSEPRPERASTLPKATVASKPQAVDPVVALAPAKHRWLWRSMGAAAVVVGWIFISWSNRYRFTAPVVMLQLGWLSVVAAIYFLARVGAAAASEFDPNDIWWKPVGKLAELEHQKRALFKAIKEIEFDQQMGKQSEADAREMIMVYRAAAIEVIKAIESGGQVDASLSAREQIAQEVRARMQLVGQSKRNAGKVRHAKDQPSSAMTPEAVPGGAESEESANDADVAAHADVVGAPSENSIQVDASNTSDNVSAVTDRGPS